MLRLRSIAKSKHRQSSKQMLLNAHSQHWRRLHLYTCRLKCQGKCPPSAFLPGEVCFLHVCSQLCIRAKLWIKRKTFLGFFWNESKRRLSVSCKSKLLLSICASPQKHERTFRRHRADQARFFFCFFFEVSAQRWLKFLNKLNMFRVLRSLPFNPAGNEDTPHLMLTVVR